MDVRCPQCQTLYELDNDQVGQRAVTLKCSQCQHVFRLGGRSTISEENQRRWMVRRKVEGDILYLNTFDTLHEWIMKREVGDEDEISRTGAKWMQLGDVGEFQPMFQVVASIAALGPDVADASDTSSILTMRSDTPTSVEAADKAEHRARIRTSIQYGGAGTPPPSQAQMRTEDITKKVRPSDVMPDDVATELEAHFASEVSEVSEPQEDEADQGSAARQEPMRPTLATADISRERPDDPAHEPSSGVAIWLLVAVLALAAVGAYAWLFQQEDFLKKDPDVVVIGATNNTTKEPTKPPPDVDTTVNAAIDAALTAAAQENDAIWTMWHETASKPFYIALDTAYAEADNASVGVELDQQLRDARVALENGRAQQASRQYRTILAKHPQNAAAVAGLGWAFLELGSSKDAAAQFKKSIELDESEGDAYIGLGTSYRQLGRLQEAYNAYDRYLGRFPKGAKATIASYQMQQLKKQLGM